MAAAQVERAQAAIIFIASKTRYGRSVTDACIGWDATVQVLETLAAVNQRQAGASA